MVGYGRGLITMCSALMQALIFQCPGLMVQCTVKNGVEVVEIQKSMGGELS